MPRRKERTRAKRLNDRVIAELRESIHSGHPWIHTAERVRGWFDLLGLVEGKWYPFTDFVEEAAVEARRGLWEDLRDDIIPEHIRRRPGTRPSAWWSFDAPEPRRVIATDGYAAVNRGLIYEDDLDYLRRLDLLSDVEKTLTRES